MPKINQHHHLKLHHNTWVFRFRWPDDVRKFVRQTEFIKSTNTHNLHEALVKRDVMLSECKKSLYFFRSDDEKARQQELLLFRKKWSEAPVVEDEEGFIAKEADDLQEEIFARAVDLHVEGGMDALIKEHKKYPAEPSYDNALHRLRSLKSVNNYIRLATNQKELSTTLVHHLNEWVSWRRNDVVPKHVDDGKAVVLKFAKDFPTVDHVNQHDVWRWFENLRTGSATQKKLGTSRRKKIKGSLVSYWKFLQRNLDTPIVPLGVTPFAEVTFPTDKRRKQFLVNETWKAFPKLGEDVVSLMRAVEAKEDEDLWLLLVISMFTGMRPEEIGQAKMGDIAIDEKCIHIPKSKTNAGIRDVPIHEGLVDTLKLLTRYSARKFENNMPGLDRRDLKRRQQEEDNKYLIEGLVSKNKYGIRSDAASKRFGNLKTKLGYDHTIVLYSFRKTVITLLAQAGISSDIIPYIVGHEPSSFTLSVYSGGPSKQQKLDAINTIQYPDFDTDWWQFFDQAGAESD